MVGRVRAGAALIAAGTSTGASSLALLVERAASGNSQAFDALIRPRLDRLFRMALAITGGEADARDAVQEACVSAWRELPRLRNVDRFDSWLAQILVNACRAHLRRQRRARVREIRVDVEEGGLPAVALSSPEHGEQIAEIELIRRAFRRLPVDARTLLVLHYQQEQPLAEIARAMGAPVGTIKWRLSSARKALDRALEVERR